METRFHRKHQHRTPIVRDRVTDLDSVGHISNPSNQLTMSKDAVKLILGVIIIGFIILIAATAAQLIDREKALDRITQWPDINVQTIEGEKFATSKLASDDPILFNYFSTECIFCQAEIEDMANHKELQESATLVLISDELPDVINQFRRNHGLDENPNFLFLVDSGRQVKDFYRIRSVPATYLYNHDGELVEFFRGQIKAETLYSHIQKMSVQEY